MKSQILTFFVGSLIFYQVGNSAENLKTKKLEKLDVQKVKKIGTAISGSKLQILNDQSLQLLLVEFISDGNDIQSTTQLAEPKKGRPVPKWELININSDYRIFPILSDEKRLYVSLYGSDFSIPKELEDELTKVYKEKGTPDTFRIEGYQMKQIFDVFKINTNENIFWFLFDDPRERKSSIDQIKSLIIKPNVAGDGVFGTVGIELTSKEIKPASLTAIGLAFIGSKNILRPSEGTEPQWKDTQFPVLTEKVAELADFISPIGNSGSRFIKEPLKFQKVQLGELEFIQAIAQFDRQYDISDKHQGITENLLGFFLKENDRIVTVYDFYLDTT